ncbi:MAG TPA: polysaccharide biosynthesis tyrosine autokinase [Pyrinomonadaceae bacterium]|jgi:capsular exopolysaccharide synthesis family protein
MDNDQRLTPLPASIGDLQTTSHAYSPAYTGFYDDESIEGKRSIRQYINVVYKRLPIILAITLIVTSAVALYMFRQPPEYSATTEMLIEPPRNPITGTKDSININFGSDVNYQNTQLQLLHSPDLMKDVVVDLGLYRNPDLFGNQNRGLLSGLKSIISRDKPGGAKDDVLPVVEQVPDSNGDKPKVVLSPEEESRANAYTGILLGGLSVDPVERTNIVNISIKSDNPAVAAQVADGVAALFKEQDAERQSAGARQAYEDLKKSIDTLTDSINSDEGKLIAEMTDKNLALTGDKGTDLSATRLQGLSETWMKSMETRRGLEARYNAAIQANARGEAVNIPDISNNPIYIEAVKQNRERRAKLQDDIRAVQTQENELETKYKANSTKWQDIHPEQKALQAQIDSLKARESQMQNEVDNITTQEQKKTEQTAVSGALTSLKSQVDAARTQESQSKAAYDQEAQAANTQGIANTELTTLKRSIETNRTLLDTYTQRQKEQELAIASNKPNNIQVSANAVTPTSPIGPARGRNIFVAFLVSFAAGIGLAFLLDYLDDSVKSSDDIGRHLGLPTLALIPHYVSADRRKLALAPANGNGDPSAAALIALQERNSPTAEAYRHLRTSLLFSSAGKPPQTILITSSQPAEGKTTTAINTAVTLAQADADVVVIDCDLRRPRVHNYFGLENSRGLTNYLSGERDTDSLIKSYAELPRLKVITSGPIPPNPAELLSSDEMKELLISLKGKFRHVIIDSPPAISFTDAAILSTIVDGVVLVAMANKSSIHLMRRFKQRLGGIGARIYGVVLNGIKSGSIEYEYYGAGYYNYYKNSDDMSTPVMEDVETVHTTNGRGA